MGRGRHRSSNPTRRRRDEDDDPHEFDLLEKGGKGWSWMKEKKYKRMFEEIEGGLEGVHGSGSFDWVDRRVFDQVFDRSTLMGLYKLMKNGTIDTLEFPIARGKEARILCHWAAWTCSGEDLPYFECGIQESHAVHRRRP